ncbi:hypothetical protein [Halorussus marinus]|uniref:hypothetical protein n=1 Tax=Halorussus marinus TaxID=2505976 RepID=UPI001091EAFC|nr:hypothetical protein [Halorussus marinus]
MSTDTSAPSQIAETVPRDPSAFRPSKHFASKVKDLGTDRNRHLDGEIINGCIEHGSRRKVDSGVYHLRETFGGATYRLVVDVDDREVVTGYPISINTDAAKRSGRWSTDQIEDIRHFIKTDPRPDRDYSDS